MCPSPGVLRSFSETWKWTRRSPAARMAPAGSFSSMLTWKVSIIMRSPGWATSSTNRAASSAQTEVVQPGSKGFPRRAIRGEHGEFDAVVPPAFDVREQAAVRFGCRRRPQQDVHANSHLAPPNGASDPTSRKGHRPEGTAKTRKWAKTRNPADWEGGVSLGLFP